MSKIEQLEPINGDGEIISQSFYEYSKIEKPDGVVGSDGITRKIYDIPYFSEAIKENRIQIIEEKDKVTGILKINSKDQERLNDLFSAGSENVIAYDKKNTELQFPAKSIDVFGCKISLLKGTDIDGRPVNTVKNLVYIEVPNDSDATIEGLLIDVLDIKQEGTAIQQKLKNTEIKRLFKLQNKTELEDISGISEVNAFPGYKTYKINGRKELLENEEGTFAFSHTFIGVNPEYAGESLVSIIKSGGLLSSNERYKRKLFSEERVGFYPESDIRSGGADYVFTYLLSEHNQGSKYTMDLIINPNVSNRLDWFSYPKDAYGTDPENHTDLTETPDEALKRVAGGNIRGEQFFQYGIGLKDILFVSCGDTEQRDTLIGKLKSSGITEVNNKPVEDWILLQKTYHEVFDKVIEDTSV